MTSQQRRGWLIVGAMFLCMLFTTGTQTGIGVFVKPLLSYFGGSRARISTIMTADRFACVVVSGGAGWLLDRYDARWIVAGGMALLGSGFLLASQAHVFTTLLLGYVLAGLATAFAGSVPATLLVANWLPERRAIALALTFTGAAGGGSIIAALAAVVIEHSSWRWAYVMLGVPPILLVAPLILLLVRTRPPTASASAAEAPRAAESDSAQPGLEVAQALRGRFFWLISFMFAGWSLGGSAIVLHFPPYLIEAGYSTAQAAFAIGLLLALSAAGKLLGGLAVGRFGVRAVLSLTFIGLALGQALLVRRPTPALVDSYVALTGILLGVPLVLVPLLEVEAFGLRRFGTLSGLCNMIYLCGSSGGAIAAGALYDLYRSYRPAFLLMSLIYAGFALTPFACQSFSAEPAATPSIAAFGTD